MNLRATEKEKTKQSLREAIERLKSGNVTAKTLLGKKNIKINRLTVEIEAGMSKGSLRHHPDIVAEINALAGLALQSALPEEKSVTPVDELKKKIALKDGLRKQYYDELLATREAMKTQLEAQHELVVALFDKIPLEVRNGLFDSAQGVNVVTFPKK
ncbi:TPA: hypothetical protein ACSP19_004113 [Aeromonas veronii]